MTPVDETHRQEFFRHVPRLRAHARQALAAAEALAQPPGSQTQLSHACARPQTPLFKAYYPMEQLEKLWRFAYGVAALRFLDAESLRWQRLPSFLRGSR